MTKAETKRKFDEIVAFAEIEQFIDTAVKHYSSGMYVRLAFAVAAHLEPDILLLDEVLSVGDMAFQRKCLRKLESLRDQTRAILVVSHNMISIRAICTRAILLSEGKIAASGSTEVVVPLYEKLVFDGNLTERDEHESGTGQIVVESVRLRDETGTERRVFRTGQPVRIAIEYRAPQRVESPVGYAAIRRPDGFICVGSSTKLEGVPLPDLEGTGVIELEIPELLVLPGHYVLDVVFYDHNFEYRRYFLGRKQTPLEVESRRSSLDEKYGVVYQKQNWKIITCGTRASQASATSGVPPQRG